MKYTLHIKFKIGKDLYKDRKPPKEAPDWWKQLEGEWEVTEQSAYEDTNKNKGAWFYTFATLRKGISEPVAGCAVLNPHDMIDKEYGKRLAYRRSVEALLKKMFVNDPSTFAVFSKETKAEVIQKFRYARYNALKQLNEKEK